MVHYGTLYNNTNLAHKHRILNNLILESVVLHARVLIQFFTNATRGRGGRDKDPRARDFLKEGAVWTLPVIDETHYPNLKKVIDKADKEIAHLSYERVPVREKKTNWDLVGILEEISTIFDSYLPLCREDYEVEKLHKLVKTSLKLVEDLKKQEILR